VQGDLLIFQRARGGNMWRTLKLWWLALEPTWLNRYDHSRLRQLVKNSSGPQQYYIGDLHKCGTQRAAHGFSMSAQHLLDLHDLPLNKEAYCQPDKYKYLVCLCTLYKTFKLFAGPRCSSTSPLQMSLLEELLRNIFGYNPCHARKSYIYLSLLGLR